MYQVNCKISGVYEYAYPSDDSIGTYVKFTDVPSIYIGNGIYYVVSHYTLLDDSEYVVGDYYRFVDFTW